MCVGCSHLCVTKCKWKPDIKLRCPSSAIVCYFFSWDGDGSGHDAVAFVVAKMERWGGQEPKVSSYLRHSPVHSA